MCACLYGCNVLALKCDCWNSVGGNPYQYMGNMHTNSLQIVSWVGFKLRIPILQGKRPKHWAALLPQPSFYFLVFGGCEVCFTVRYTFPSPLYTLSVLITDRSGGLLKWRICTFKKKIIWADGIGYRHSLMVLHSYKPIVMQGVCFWVLYCWVCLPADCTQCSS